MTDRQKLEAKQEELVRILSSGEKVMRNSIVTQLHDTIDTIAELDAAKHFTQMQGDTLVKIVLRELSLTQRRVLLQQGREGHGTQ